MILYQGLLRSPASWARVGRGYLKALLDQGWSVGAVAARGFRHDPAFPLPDGLRVYRPREARALTSVEVGLGFLHPTVLGRLIGERKVNCFVWEASRVPAGWVEPLAAGAELVLVPSEFARRALVESGFPAARARVVPYGYDRNALDSIRASGRAREAGPLPGRCTFLSVMTPHYRKGVVELLTAYRRAFTSSDDVTLRIKTTYDPGRERRRSPFEIPSWSRVLEDAGLDDERAPRVEIDETPLFDQAMLEGYADADVVVQPSWGEAFGLAMLEALAVGVPVVATDWGGQTDFLPRGDDRLPFRLEPAGSSVYETADEALVARPDVDALAARLCWHHDHREESRLLGQRGRVHAEPWTWDAAAKQLVEELGLS